MAASKRDDTPVTFGNYGPCVDLFAPGEDILSADNVSDTSVKQRGGSSTAAALVAGAVALYLEYHPHATPHDVKCALIPSALDNGLTMSAHDDPNGNTPNRLLNLDRLLD